MDSTVRPEIFNVLFFIGKKRHLARGPEEKKMKQLLVKTRLETKVLGHESYCRTVL